MQKLAIVTTHPIQYNAPLFSLLSKRENIKIKVFYTWGQTQLAGKFDPGFGKNIDWDIPLLEEYEHVFIENIAPNPGTHHFRGIINPQLIPTIREWAPNTILFFGWNFVSHLNGIKYFYKNIPVLFRGDSTLLDETRGIRKIVRRILLRWIYTHIDFAFYVGTHNRSYFIKHGLKENQLFFAPHAVDNMRFFDEQGVLTARAKEWRKRLNIDTEDMVFLFAGKLEPKKNPELLIRAFEAIQQNGIHLVIVGNGILENDLKQKYRRVKNLHFIDFQNQSIMPLVYRLGNVFVLPSGGPGETWGLSVNEAMASERPVLVSDRAGCAFDLVENGRNGYIFKSMDKNDLQEKLCLFLANKAALKTMGVESAKKIKKWDLRITAAAIEKIVTKFHE